MIKHLVLWKLKPEAHGKTAAENAVYIKEILEALRGKVPGLIRLDVGTDFSRTDVSADIALYSEFENEEALAAYNVFPEHVAAKTYISAAITERRIADFK